jgi:hypothetical protein
VGRRHAGSVAVSPDGRRLAVTVEDRHEVVLADAATGAVTGGTRRAPSRTGRLRRRVRGCLRARPTTSR